MGCHKVDKYHAQAKQDAIRAPNFLLIGAQKAGTSWLSAMLGQHPDIYIPAKKELHFFNLRENYNRGIDWYYQEFAGHGGKKRVGECTPNYLWVRNAPDCVQAARRVQRKPPIQFWEYPYVIRDIHELVHTHLPKIQLIVSLRNPVDRAISSYYHAVRRRKISPRLSLMEAGGQQGILGMGFYYRHLIQWMKLFSREQFIILIYEEDIVAHKQQTLKKIFRYLQVNEDFLPDEMERKFNPRASHLFMYMHYYFPRCTRWLFKEFPKLHQIDIPLIKVTERDREELRQLYKDENHRLEELLGRSLDVWNNRKQGTEENKRFAGSYLCG